MGNIFSLYDSILQLFGLKNKQIKIIFIGIQDLDYFHLGLDNSGKTTLLYYLADNKISSFAPTTVKILYYSFQEVNKKMFVKDNITFDAFDLGGHEVRTNCI